MPKGKDSVLKQHAMMYGGMETKFHTFATWALHGSEWSTSWFIPGYPLPRRLGGYQSWSVHGSKVKSPCPCQEAS